MQKREDSNQYKLLKDYSGDFNEELDKELKKIPSLKEKLIYLYRLQRQNENNNVLSGGFYFISMVIQNRLKYYDSALQYTKLNKSESSKTGNNKIDEKPKIVWKKSKEDLIALIDKLIDIGFIGYEKDKNELIAEHFGWMFESPKVKPVEPNPVDTKPSYKIIKSENSNTKTKDGIKTFFETFERNKKNPLI
jgi:hypothetical protein